MGEIDQVIHSLITNNLSNERLIVPALRHLPTVVEENGQKLIVKVYCDSFNFF